MKNFKILGIDLTYNKKTEKYEISYQNQVIDLGADLYSAVVKTIDIVNSELSYDAHTYCVYRLKDDWFLLKEYADYVCGWFKGFSDYQDHSESGKAGEEVYFKAQAIRLSDCATGEMRWKVNNWEAWDNNDTEGCCDWENPHEFIEE